ncbi:uncharacterized protein FA14DRAFT_159462 [Meira miltonrushii]|uniref:Sas10 C-terminal domain-containing protein n=1 Tax=Meira miltonrushii TaxID=1280837 RepID=A0A316VK02_9BASI|nr:uncharacterized protein FA14DRAFT_159462 [Meira miltonrushii]PWN37388.1 hypothetical protein FA14DRAFT_159462 [Meira miltonrushii]
MVRKGRRSRGSGEGTSNSLMQQGKKFTEEDISDDEIDSFNDQRDEIILNGRDRKSKNATNNQDPFDALATGSRSVLDVDEGEDSDDEDGQDVLAADIAPKERRKKEFKKKPTTQTPLADDSSDDDDAAEEEEEDLPTGGWGSNKRSYYNTNDLDDLESDSEMDEEEMRAMEVREVKKLQSRARQGMVDDDFGLGDQNANIESGQAAREQRKRDLDVDVTKIAQAQPAVPINPAELIAKVQREKPELMALIGEYADMVDDMHTASNRMKNLQDTNPGHSSLGLLHLHHQTLLSYITSLAFYFYVSALRTDDSKVKSTNASNSIKTQIIERLAKLKQGLSSLEDFGLGLEEEEASIEMDDEEDAEENDENQAPQFLFKPYGVMSADGDSDDGSVSLGSLEEDELMQLDAEERSADVSGQEAAKAKVEDRIQKPEKKQTKQKKQQTSIPPPAPLAGLADILNEEGDISNAGPPAKRRKQAGRVVNSAYDEYSEPTALSTVDEAEKDAKRRSLKFHTGHLDALDSRKKNARQLDGDVDIPYRDKERSRLAVASTNANKAAKVNGVDASRRQLDADDFGEADARDWRDVMDADGDLGENAGGRSGFSASGSGGDADYYDLITSSRKAAKEAQKEHYDQQRASERFVPDDAGLEPGEHRAINRQIEKNRGLTQRRPKTARNPRVKKRQRYEQAQKKLSSRGPVYKGGQSSLQGGYGGEKSGISTHVVKSRQFA